MAVTAAVVGIVAAVAGTGTSAYESHATQVHADQQQRDKETALNKQQDEMSSQQEKTKNDQAAVAASARQRAITASSAPSTYGGTLKTSALGVQNPLQYAQKSLLGT